MLKKETSANSIITSDIEMIFMLGKNELDLLSGKIILITGGAGFIGYTLLHSLINIGNGDQREPPIIVVFENFVRGRKLWFDNLVKQKKIMVIEHDITRELPSYMPDFDYIIHAASIASPTYYRLHPIETIDANINGLRYLLYYAKKRADSSKPILGFLFFSTSEIYGDPSDDNIPTIESYRGFVSCTGPRACYDESKRLGETLCVNFSQKYEVPVTSARPFNNYGPGLDINDKRLLPDLARNILYGNDIVLFSDGKATRTFCYIADAIVGYLKVLTMGRSGESYNIGTESPEISVAEFTEHVLNIARETIGYNGKIVYKKNRDDSYLIDNPNRRCPNINKAKKELGYYPSVDLINGIERSLVWYKENL
jgi:nucleoside-diphosphate-sugar epimerase